jgi:hypothetical protein
VIVVRLVLLVLGQAAMVSGSSVVGFGCRNLACTRPLRHRLVTRILQLLRDEPDPLIDLVSRRQAAPLFRRESLESVTDQVTTASGRGRHSLTYPDIGTALNCGNPT